MTILLCGGGTGGHITPLLAVARELKNSNPENSIIYVGENNGKFASLLNNQYSIDEIYSVHAGKFRRYHNQSWLIRVFDFKTNLQNLVDVFCLIIGFFESIVLLRRCRPKVIFIKGGYVSVPIGLAAALLKIPFITHDSDSVSGLANRIIGRWAKIRAVALPEELYNLPKHKTRFVGIPIDGNYQKLTHQQKIHARELLGIDGASPVVLITGGSLGAQRLNNYINLIIPRLLENQPKLIILHQTGQDDSVYVNLDQIRQKRIHEFKFANNLYRYSAAADIVICRAGATTVAELGAQAKACILVPNPELTGGHQTKNAKYLAGKGAVLDISESRLKASPQILIDAIEDLLAYPNKRAELGEKLYSITITNSAQRVAKLIEQTVA